jgi:DnaJ-domain-containing protein 1
MDDSAPRTQQVRLPVELEMDGGQRMTGSLFVSQSVRLPDLLNDERPFIPFETHDGLLKMLRKSTIRAVTPQHQVMLAPTSNDPYEILGVAPSIADEDLKAVYHRKVQQTHPDRLVAMGLPTEIVQLASDKIARINEAYERICQQRKNRADAAPKWYHGG